jgi:hypothetical protein
MMNNVELITVALLIALLSGKTLISAHGASGPKRKHMRMLDILIAPLLIAFCVIVVKTVISAASG